MLANLRDDLLMVVVLGINIHRGKQVLWPLNIKLHTIFQRITKKKRGELYRTNHRR